MTTFLDEEESVLHHALLNCIRRSKSASARHAYLLMIERTIFSRTENPKFSTSFYDQLSIPDEDIKGNIMSEVQQLKMEEQVNLLGLDCSPPEDNMAAAPCVFNMNGGNDALKDDSSDASEFIDLNELIFESVELEGKNSSPPSDYRPSVNDHVVSLDSANNDAQTPAVEEPKSNFDEIVNPPAPIPTFGKTDPPRAPISDQSPPGYDSCVVIDTSLDAPPENSALLKPTSTRPPGKGPPPDLHSPILIGSEHAVEVQPPQQRSDSMSSNGSQSRSTFTLVRPKGVLPPPTFNSRPMQPVNLPSPINLPSPVLAPTFPPLQPSEDNLSPSYETQPLPELSRQNTDSSDYYSSERTDKERSSSNESGGGGGGVVYPETNKGNTVYRNKRISQAQLLAFLEDSALRTKLRELGSFYLISACDESNFYNISLSGDKKNTERGMELLTSSLPETSTVYTEEQLTFNSCRELKGSGYLITLIRKLYPGVQVRVEEGEGGQSRLKMSGPEDKVAEIKTLTKFMISRPEKHFGMLLKLHPRLTSSEDLVGTLVSSAQAITKTTVMCLDCTKTEQCKFLFVAGICGTDSHYKLQKHLNLLAEKLEIEDDGAEVVEPPPTPSSKYTYSYETMLVIRQNCSRPHPALLNNQSLPVRLIKSHAP